LGRGSADTVYTSPARYVGVEEETPDGRDLVASGPSPKHGWDVVSIPLAGGEAEPRAVGESHQIQGRVSPNGQYLAYASYESGRWEVYVTTYAGGGGRWQVSSTGGTEPFWRSDGRELFFVSLDRRLTSVDVDMGPPIEFGIPQKLFDAPMPRGYLTRNRYWPTADGQKFLMLTLLDRGRVPPTTVILNWAADLADR
jgi:hypothetical protein